MNQQPSPPRPGGQPSIESRAAVLGRLLPSATTATNDACKTTSSVRVRPTADSRCSDAEVRCCIANGRLSSEKERTCRWSFASDPATHNQESNRDITNEPSTFLHQYMPRNVGYFSNCFFLLVFLPPSSLFLLLRRFANLCGRSP